MSGAGPGSFWLVPDKGTRAFFRDLIEDLSREYHAPIFTPHVTLYSGEGMDPLKTCREVAALLATVPPLELEVMETATSDAFFRTFVVRLGKNKAVTRLRRRLAGLAEERRSRPFEPHLSLLYQRLTPAARELLPARYPIDVQRIGFDEVWLVTPANPDLGWRDVASWRVRGRFELVG